MVDLVRSRQRIADHGEVFTPPSLAQEMLDLVEAESRRIDSRFLEPACGSGNFLVPVLERKLASVRSRYQRNEYASRQHALQAVMSIYGIELLHDNVADCRRNLLERAVVFLGIEEDDVIVRAFEVVLAANIVHGDALSLTMCDAEAEPITFPEWAYLGKGWFGRRDFRFDSLTQASTFNGAGSLWADLGKHEIFTPVRDYGRLRVSDIAQLADLR